MIFNDKGLTLLKEYEGCSLKAYPDPGTGNKPYTIGYGHTGSDVSIDSKWTQAQADRQLAMDADNRADEVIKCLKVTLNDNQFSALVCFVYNVGIGNFKSSTLLERINSGQFEDVKTELQKWIRSGGKILPGLIRRRQAESDLFFDSEN